MTKMLTLSFYDLHFWKFQSAKIAQYFYGGVKMQQPQLTITRKVNSGSSWSEIYNYILNGRANSILSVGDSIDCVLKNGNHIKIDVAGINIYNQNEVVFCFHNIFDKMIMNENRTNAGGFPQAGMLAHLDDIFDLLPDDLQAIVTPRKIVQEFRTNRTGYKAKLWLPSLVEVFGDRYARYDCEGVNANNKPLPIFQDPENIAKLFEGYSAHFWLRSPYTLHTNGFWFVTSTGYVSGDNATCANGVVPCFSISKAKELIVCTEESLFNFI